MSLDGILLALGAGACWASYIFFGQKAAADAHGGFSVASEKPDVLITLATRTRRRIAGPSSRGCIVVYVPE